MPTKSRPGVNSSGVAMSWDGVRFLGLFFLLMLAACSKPPPFSADGQEIVSVDVLRLRSLVGGVIPFGDCLASGEDFERMTQLLIESPKRWERQEGVLEEHFPSHRLDCHLPEGPPVSVWVDSDFLMTEDWFMRITSTEAGWFYRRASSYEEQMIVDDEFELAAGSPPNTPPSKYASDLPYKFVYVDGELFLKLTGTYEPSTGPYQKVSENQFTFEEPGRGIHSVAKHDESWWYSWSYVMMSSVEVDASELGL